jgi:hypothetical protein
VFLIAEHKRAAVPDAVQARFNKKIPLRKVSGAFLRGFGKR